MFEICLFDLDDTLVRTEDLKEVREACVGSAAGSKPVNALQAALAEQQDRRIYSLEMLRAIRKEFPELKLGIFTRSPRSYANVVLAWAYPGFDWDIVVAYEDVSKTKPHGDGIDLAMNTFGVTYLDKVMLVGDNDVDVRAAYNCGCIAVLDQSSWPSGKRRQEHWRALGQVPDAIIDSPEQLMQVLAKPKSFLPELERLIAKETVTAAGARFDRINHFVPQEIAEDQKAYPVHVCGRSFTQYESLKYRRKWHELTQSIEAHKDADAFPDDWINAIRRLIVDQYPSLFAPAKIVVTAIPHRPGRKARLEALIQQLGESVVQNPIPRRTVVAAPDLLAFKDGVKSQHNDYLNREQRFANVRDHLYVKLPQLAEGKSVLVLDDVVTTGASLIYATIHLKAAGAREVKCLAVAKSIGDVL